MFDEYFSPLRTNGRFSKGILVFSLKKYIFFFFLNRALFSYQFLWFYHLQHVRTQQC